MLGRSNRHPALLRADETLLVVVDVQEPFLRAIWEKDRLIQNLSLLVNACKVLRVPVVPTLQNEEQMGGVIPPIQKLLPPDSIPFDKMCFSCVGDDAFSSEVMRSGRKQILLSGIEAHVCVAQTALDLAALGFQVHVAADAISARSQSNWQIGLDKMERNGVSVSSTEMAIYEMLELAGTPEFREILGFLKA